MPPQKRNVDDILKEYGSKIESRMTIFNSNSQGKTDYSQSYMKFKAEMAPEISRYERLCKSLGNLVRLKVSAADELKVKRELNIAHLDLDPWQPLTLSIVSFLSIFFIGLIISVAIALINGGADIEGVFSAFPFLFFFLCIILSLFMFYFMKNYPARLANKWRLKASSQMVPAILYVVVYMRHTSNLERAIAFASEHL